ncbi:hypothetical protein CDA63_16645 [Hymenobacter amundsenii]|uniref:Uncharacterized protein n=1 Tax=Hymenobacter amundsenii TaxID=2006685 RepID=A0A246FHI2_9BACT|nr:hypothetical protein [Hymenobacter amundsenii]OWP61989.1 hypothetical protein CDA63_16645 [Hymenobacter amundsenii]
MNLAAQFNDYIRQQNSAPRTDFCGLNPDQIYRLIYSSLGPGSPVRLCENLPDAVLDQVPLLLLTEAFLRIIRRDKSIKLTAAGALPRKYLLELYGLGLLPEPNLDSGLIKLSREQDSLVLSALHINTILAGLAKKVHGQLTLTKKAEQLLTPTQRPALLEVVLVTFTEKFNWPYFDLYPSESTGQMAWLYSVYLLAKFGHEVRPASFYADKYQLAFPLVRADFPDQPYASPEQQLRRCYCVRTFGRSLNWFGLVTVGNSPHYLDTDSSQVAATGLLAQLFDVWQAPETPIL